MQNLRTLTFGSLDAEALRDALRQLDLTRTPVTRTPPIQFAWEWVTVVEGSGRDLYEEALADLEQIDLNKTPVDASQ